MWTNGMATTRLNFDSRRWQSRSDAVAFLAAKDRRCLRLEITQLVTH